MLCAILSNIQCLRTENHYGLLSAIRILTTEIFGQSSLGNDTDDTEKSKGAENFQISHSKGINVTIEGMGRYLVAPIIVSSIFLFGTFYNRFFL